VTNGILQETSISKIKRENDTLYGTLEDLKLEIDSFFVKPSIEGGDINVANRVIPKSDGLGNLNGSNISQDEDGKIRVSTVIVAEAGVDSIPATYILGDGLGLSGSGPQQINTSNITGSKYQIPYQEIDKSGCSNTFEVCAEAEERQVFQGISDTVLSSGGVVSVQFLDNFIMNALYVKTNGTVRNFRFQAKSLTTNKIIESYPDKFKYADDIGVDLIGAGLHKIDFYFEGTSTPQRYIKDQVIEFTNKWENDGGDLLGNSSLELYVEYDRQVFSFDNLAKESYVDDKLDIAWAAGYFGYEETICTNQSQWYKVDATFTPELEKNFTFDLINNRWVYNNGGEGLSIFATFTGHHDDVNTRKLEWQFRINGDEANNPYPNKKATIEPNDTMSISMMMPYYNFTNGDYVELFCRVTDSPYDNIRTSNCSFLIR